MTTLYEGSVNPSPKTLAHLEIEYIEAMLHQYDFHIVNTANALGIGRATLYRKIKKYNISVPRRRKSSE